MLSQRHHPIVWHDKRDKRQNLELEKESLTFVFALAYAAAHAGPKSGSWEEPTYENVIRTRQFQRKSR